MPLPTGPELARLADLLLTAGVAPARVEEARAAALLEDQPLAAIVLRMRLLGSRELAQLLAGALRVAVHHVGEPPASLPSALARRVQAMALGWITVEGERRQLVGMVDPTDVSARLDVIRALGCPVQFVLVEADEVTPIVGVSHGFEPTATGPITAANTLDVELLARIANTVVQDRSAPLLSRGETVPTVRTRLLRALADSSAPTPIAMLRKLRLLVVAPDAVMREHAAREITGVPRFRAVLSVASAITAASLETFDAIVLLGPLEPSDHASLDVLADRACVVAVATNVEGPAVLGRVAGPIEEGKLAAAIARALVAATAAPINLPAR